MSTLSSDSAPADFRWWNPVHLFRNPRYLFHRADASGPLGLLLLYAFAWQFVSVVMELAVSFIRPAILPSPLMGKIGWFFVGPVAGFAGWAVSSVYIFFLWHLMGSERRYASTVRALALLMPLAAVRALLSVVPYLHLLVWVYLFYLLIIASIELHGVKPRVAWTVWSVVLGLFVVGSILAQVGMAMRQMGGGLTPPPFVSAPQNLPGQGMMPPELQKQVEDELKKHQALVEKLEKEPRGGENPKGPK